MGRVALLCLTSEGCVYIDIYIYLSLSHVVALVYIYINLYFNVIEVVLKFDLTCNLQVAIFATGRSTHVSPPRGSADQEPSLQLELEDS